MNSSIKLGVVGALFSAIAFAMGGAASAADQVAITAESLVDTAEIAGEASQDATPLDARSVCIGDCVDARYLCKQRCDSKEGDEKSGCRNSCDWAHAACIQACPK